MFLKILRERNISIASVQLQSKFFLYKNGNIVLNNSPIEKNYLVSKSVYAPGMHVQIFFYIIK